MQSDVMARRAQTVYAEKVRIEGTDERIYDIEYERRERKVIVRGICQSTICLAVLAYETRRIPHLYDLKVY